MTRQSGSFAALNKKKNPANTVSTQICFRWNRGETCLDQPWHRKHVRRQCNGAQQATKCSRLMTFAGSCVGLSMGSKPAQQDLGDRAALILIQSHSHRSFTSNLALA